MSGKDIAGLIYSNGHDECLAELTAQRTMGSIPFGGRYRLIDFMLSNMVNFGISKIGVLTKNNYRSLMDHLGSGRPWDLARKTEGLYLLPPFNTTGAGGQDNRLTAYIGAEEFLSFSTQEYVLMCDCNAVCNLDLSKLKAFHLEKDADITIVYTNGKLPALKDIITFGLDGDGRVSSIEVAPKTDDACNFSTNIILMKRSLLLSLLRGVQSHGYTDFERDVLQKNVSSLKIYGYRAPGFCRVIDSQQSYYDVNMELLQYDNRADLFCDDRPIFTKVKDDMPTVYGLESSVKNSLIADGCIISGEVENSVISRGVIVEEGAVVKNCILMQGAYVGAGCALNCIIADKSVVITPRKSLSGAENYPVYIEKKTVI